MHKTMGIAVLAFGSAIALSPAALADAASETVTAATHAQLAVDASDLKGVHLHLHHALNCLVGPGGNGFDAKQLNPCAQSGRGAIPDTSDPGKLVSLETAADRARAGIAAEDLKKAKADAKAVVSTLKGGK
jgi:hypothetical protein